MKIGSLVLCCGCMELVRWERFKICLSWLNSKMDLVVKADSRSLLSQLGQGKLLTPCPKDTVMLIPDVATSGFLIKEAGYSSRKFRWYSLLRI